MLVAERDAGALLVVREPHRRSLAPTLFGAGQAVWWDGRFVLSLGSLAGGSSLTQDERLALVRGPVLGDAVGSAARPDERRAGAQLRVVQTDDATWNKALGALPVLQRVRMPRALRNSLPMVLDERGDVVGVPPLAVRHLRADQDAAEAVSVRAHFVVARQAHAGAD